MAVHKSIIQSTELSTGTELYVQINNGKASLSIDGKEMQTSVWLTLEELDDLRKIILNALAEHGSENAV